MPVKDIPRIADEIYPPLFLPGRTVEKALPNFCLPTSHTETEPLEILPYELLKWEYLRPGSNRGVWRQLVRRGFQVRRDF
jgi:hypothetical protein